LASLGRFGAAGSAPPGARVWLRSRKREEPPSPPAGSCVRNVAWRGSGDPQAVSGVTGQPAHALLVGRLLPLSGPRSAPLALPSPLPAAARAASSGRVLPDSGRWPSAF
jgi:hypothetical protein